jgi:hypothetical protein
MLYYIYYYLIIFGRFNCNSPQRANENLLVRSLCGGGGWSSKAVDRQ